jgi:hypothetical protein
VVGVRACHHWLWAILGEFAADSKEITGSLLHAHTEFQPNLERSRQQNRLLFFTASAFHTNRDGCFMSLGGVEFAVFSKPLDADVEARLNGEYLWGRHFVFHHGKRPFRFPFLFRSQEFAQSATPPS